jgi:hypothetical protein
VLVWAKAHGVPLPAAKLRRFAWRDDVRRWLARQKG